MIRLKTFFVRISCVVLILIFIKISFIGKDFISKLGAIFIVLCFFIYLIYDIFGDYFQPLKFVKVIALKTSHYKVDIFTLSFLTVGGYFTTFALFYGIVHNHPFMLWWVSRYIFYLVTLVISSGTIYLTVQLIHTIKK